MYQPQHPRRANRSRNLCCHPGRERSPRAPHRADRQRKLRLARRHVPPRAPNSPTNTPKATRASRYYGGCEHVDVAEQLAIDRVKQIFGADAANVQPHCGASANEAVFLAFLKPGDTIMGMSLAEGGHLTHGMPLNMSGKWFNVVSLWPGRQRSHRLRRHGAQGPRAQAEADRGRCASAYSAAHRLRPLCQGGQRRRRHLHGRHGPLRRPRSPQASTPTRCRTPTWSHPPPTRACAARVAASS